MFKGAKVNFINLFHINIYIYVTIMRTTSNEKCHDDSYTPFTHEEKI
jgi:hypothetical protein